MNNESFVFTFKANDGKADSNVATVSITVNAVNDPPTAQDGTASTPEDVAASVTLQANDPEGDPLTATITQQPAHGTLSGTGLQRAYTPEANWNGTDTFKFKVNDGAADSNVATVTITVNAVNDPPVAQNSSAATNEDAPVSVSLQATDVDGDALTPAITVQPLHGALTGTGLQRAYTPDDNWHGTDTFKFTVSDGTVDSNEATVTITVGSVNDLPVAQNGAYTTDEDNGVAVTLSAEDADGDVLTPRITVQPAHGTLSGAGFNRTYSPAENWYGEDSFKFKVNDGAADSNEATVTITVNGVNDPPQADDKQVSTDRDTPVDVALVARDFDGDQLTYVVKAGPYHGKLTGTAPNLTYTPDDNYKGTDNFSFIANDGKVDSQIAVVNINVIGDNQPPTAGDGAFSVDEDKTVAVHLTGGDPDGDPISFYISRSPDNGVLSGDPGGANDADWTYTPNSNWNGTDTFEFRVSDGSLDAYGTATITVRAVNDAPVAPANQPASTSLGIPVVITLQANDADGDALKYQITTQPTHGTLTGAPSAADDAQWTYTPEVGYSGPDSFKFKASDTQSQSNEATVVVTVYPREVGDITVSDVDPSDPYPNSGKLEFGRVMLNHDKTLQITIANDGQAALTVTSWQTQGSEAFSAQASQSVTLAPNTETSVTVEFSPTVVGDFTGKMVISSDDPDENPTEIVLTGTCVVDAPELTFAEPAQLSLPAPGATCRISWHVENVAQGATMTLYYDADTTPNNGNEGVIAANLPATVPDNYFDWTVKEDMVGKRMYVRAEISSNSVLYRPAPALGQVMPCMIERDNNTVDGVEIWAIATKQAETDLTGKVKAFRGTGDREISFLWINGKFDEVAVYVRNANKIAAVVNSSPSGALGAFVTNSPEVGVMVTGTMTNFPLIGARVIAKGENFIIENPAPAGIGDAEDVSVAVAGKVGTLISTSALDGHVWVGGALDTAVLLGPQVTHNVSVGGKLGVFVANELTQAAQISAASAGTFVFVGKMNGSVDLAGDVGVFVAQSMKDSHLVAGGKIDLVSVSGVLDKALISGASIKTAVVGGLSGGTLNALGNMDTVIVTGNLAGSKDAPSYILAGYDLGADLKATRPGAASADDAAKNGSITTLFVVGTTNCANIAAGVGAGLDNMWGTDDDVAGQGGKIATAILIGKVKDSADCNYGVVSQSGDMQLIYVGPPFINKKLTTANKEELATNVWAKAL